MKKSNLMKSILVLGISLMIVLFSANVVRAADEGNFADLTPTLDSNNTNTNNANTNNSNSNRTNNTNTNSNRTNNTNNSSIYNNTSLPKTGIADSIPVVLLIVVFGISSVYAYKKIKEYKNI